MAASKDSVDYSKEGGTYHELPSGSSWWKWTNEDGEIHRDKDKPAMIYSSGRQEWWRNGKPHRVGKPSSTFADGSYHHKVRGIEHNLKGPASFDASSGQVTYVIMGTVYATFEEFARARAEFLGEEE